MNIPIGWFVAIASILGGFIWLGGTWSQLWVPQEYLIILGGGFGALIAANKSRNLGNLFKAIGEVFVSPEASNNENIELLTLLAELLQKIETESASQIEQELKNPASSIFSKYSSLTKRTRLLEFVRDYLQKKIDGESQDALDILMEQEIAVIEIELRESAESVDTLADSMPAFGIVAAIVGVIDALSGITFGTDPGSVGKDLSKALMGTLVGVFSAYAIFAPVSRSLMQRAEAQERQFRAAKEVIISSFSCMPIVAADRGRQVLYSDQRPSSSDLRANIRKNTVGRSVG